MIKDTVLIPIYRSFGLRYLISTNIIRKLSNKYKIVLLIDIKKKKFYKKIFIKITLYILINFDFIMNLKKKKFFF